MGMFGLPSFKDINKKVKKVVQHPIKNIKGDAKKVGGVVNAMAPKAIPTPGVKKPGDWVSRIKF